MDDLALLTVRDAAKVYEGPEGGVAALRGVSFQVQPGELIAVRGPSGCGKSTLLHLIGAMDRPSSGEILLRGQDIGRLSVEELARLRRRQIGFVFQAFHLLPTFTVVENVALPLLLDGQSPRSARARAAELIDQVGLAPRSEHFPSQLSGGEMQRAAVARAVVAGPDLLLADEPTGNLDSASGRRVMELLAEMNRRLGVTVLLATHSDEAAAYARRTLRLRDGLLEAGGIVVE